MKISRFENTDFWKLIEVEHKYRSEGQVTMAWIVLESLLIHNQSIKGIQEHLSLK